ncbi:hypothetical protein ACNAW0_01035 [Micromonospora sp. SL1-18]|uniref:hypothetical protein n=1 Tax=Micromonospora sp. SL1-18 TaxID=3399128 RepID=UPI003A4DE1C4
MQLDASHQVVTRMELPGKLYSKGAADPAEKPGRHRKAPSTQGIEEFVVMSRRIFFLAAIVAVLMFGPLAYTAGASSTVGDDVEWTTSGQAIFMTSGGGSDGGFEWA